MLQEELWYIRLAEQATLQPETSLLLWRGLVQQVEQRLLSGLSLTFPEIGEWRLEEHREYVARTEEGKQWLIPPRLTLGVRPVEERSVTSISIDLLRDALSEATQVSVGQVATWLRAIPQLWRTLSEEGKQVVWIGLGSFTPILEDRELVGYRFLPAESLCASLNKPFSMFVPVELAASTSTADLDLHEQVQLDELAETKPITILFARQQPHVEELPSSAPAPEESDVVADTSESVATFQVEVVPTPAPPSSKETPGDESPSIDIPVEVPSGEEQDTRPRPLVWVLVALGIVATTVLFVYLLSMQPALELKPKAPAVEKQVEHKAMHPAHIEAPQAPVVADTLQPVEPSTAPAVETSASPSSSVEVIEHVRLRPGDRLSRLALKKYGHKAFWVYIYEENRAQLKNPDNIPVGAVITLPAASKYQINASDTNSVNKALVLQRSLYK
ncbi:LysM peptidoglycan-binding domain-containing protein [Porphyromonas sp.]